MLVSLYAEERYTWAMDLAGVRFVEMVRLCRFV
jgi:hypothetical protein